MKLHAKILRFGDRATITIQIDADPVEAAQPHIQALVDCALRAGADYVHVNGEPRR